VKEATREDAARCPSTFFVGHIYGPQVARQRHTARFESVHRHEREVVREREAKKGSHEHTQRAVTTSMVRVKGRENKRCIKLAVAHAQRHKPPLSSPPCWRTCACGVDSTRAGCTRVNTSTLAVMCDLGARTLRMRCSSMLLMICVTRPQASRCSDTAWRSAVVCLLYLKTCNLLACRSSSRNTTCLRRPAQNGMSGSSEHLRERHPRHAQ
jgi:hypothetical protein